MLADLRYSVRSFARTPGLTLALFLTVAVGICANASVRGFISGSIGRTVPISGIDTVVTLFERNAQGRFGATSYERHLSLRTHGHLFDWLGAAREWQGSALIGGDSLVVPAAAVTSEFAALLQLPLNDGVVISDRL